MKGSFNILDLLAEAKQAQRQALHLPVDVRLAITPENLVRLKLLTVANVMALADAAAENPKRWRALKLHYHFPEWTQKRIAEFMGVKPSQIKYWLKSPICDPEEYWNNLPPVEDLPPIEGLPQTSFRTWEDVPEYEEKRSEAASEESDDADGEEYLNQEEREVQDDDE